MANGILVGFEAGDASEALSTGGTFSVQSTTTRGAWSAYALRVNPVTTGTGRFNIAGHSVTGAIVGSAFSASTAYLRFYFRVDVLPAANDEIIVQVLTTATLAKAYLRINSAGHLAAYDATPTLIATGTATLSTGVWYRIELKVGTGAGAVVEWKVNGTTDVSTTATLSGTNTGSFSLGKQVNVNGNTVDYYYDDVLVSDSAYPGPGQSTLLLPNANGSYQTATIGAGSGSHFQVVDDVPHNSDTDYLVTDGTSTHAETEAMADTAGASISGTINSVKALCVLKRDGATNGSIKQRRRSGSTDSDLASAFPSTSAYTVCASILDTDPATSSPWTTSGIDGVQVGIVEQSTNKTRMTLCALAVDYTPSTGHTVIMGQCAETDLSQSQTHTKLKTTGLNTETDSLFSLQSRKTRTIGQNLETDLNQTIRHLKSHTLGLDTETDTTQSFTHTKQKPFGLATEVDSVFSLLSQKIKAIGFCTEIDTSLTTIPQRIVITGLCSESDNTFTIGVSRVYGLQIVEETDNALNIIFFTPTPRHLGEIIYGSVETLTVYGNVTTPTIYGSSDTPTLYGD